MIEKPSFRAMVSRTMDAQTIQSWKNNWQNEVDAGWLYRRLAALERKPERRQLYQRLAEIEARHAELWRKILEEHQVKSPAPRPGAKVRLQAALAKVFGSGWLLPMLVAEESGEVQHYLSLHRESEPGTIKKASMQLAQESAGHVSTLQSLSQQGGEEPWHHLGSGDMLRNIVYGFNDGLTANFGLVAGVVGGNVGPGILLLSGLAGAVADSLSMGSSGYLAAKSQAEVQAHQIEMERQELQFMPELEQEELAVIYEAKGLPPEQARQIAAQLMQDPEKALAEKVREELKISEGGDSPLRAGLTTGIATAVGALIPVVPFFFLRGMPAIWTAFVISMLAHFGVGAARSIFTGRGIFRSGVDMFLVGFGVAAVSYFFGDLLVRWLAGAK